MERYRCIPSSKLPLFIGFSFFYRYRHDAHVAFFGWPTYAASPVYIYFLGIETRQDEFISNGSSAYEKWSDEADVMAQESPMNSSRFACQCVRYNSSFLGISFFACGASVRYIIAADESPR